MRAKGTGRPAARRNPRSSDAATRRGATTAGDDGSDDEGAISLQAIKNKYKPGQQHKRNRVPLIIVKIISQIDFNGL